MIRCGECRFFLGEGYHHDGDGGNCSAEFWRKGYSPEYPNGTIHERVPIKPSDVVVENDEGWAFVVGPEFGCVHGESRG